MLINTPKPKSFQRRRRNRRVDANVVTGTLKYQGPPRVLAEQLVILDLLLDVPVTSTAGGTIADVETDIPTGSPDFASTQALFAEYRILCMTLQFIPNVTGGNVALVAYAPFYVVWDATSSVTALTSYVNATNYPISRQKSLNQPWSINHKMDGVEEATFVPVTSAIVDFSFKTFATGLTAATTYGRYIIRWKTQFRGRQ